MSDVLTHCDPLEWPTAVCITIYFPNFSLHTAYKLTEISVLQIPQSLARADARALARGARAAAPPAGRLVKLIR